MDIRGPISVFLSNQCLDTDLDIIIAAILRFNRKGIFYYNKESGGKPRKSPWKPVIAFADGSNADVRRVNRQSPNEYNPSDSVSHPKDGLAHALPTQSEVSQTGKADLDSPTVRSILAESPSERSRKAVEIEESIADAERLLSQRVFCDNSEGKE